MSQHCADSSLIAATAYSLISQGIFPGQAKPFRLADLIAIWAILACLRGFSLRILLTLKGNLGSECAACEEAASPVCVSFNTGDDVRASSKPAEVSKSRGAVLHGPERDTGRVHLARPSSAGTSPLIAGRTSAVRAMLR